MISSDWQDFYGILICMYAVIGFLIVYDYDQGE
jgi:hypothetical protein